MRICVRANPSIRICRGKAVMDLGPAANLFLNFAFFLTDDHLPDYSFLGQSIPSARECSVKGVIMKYIKMLGLAAVVAGAFMAFVGAGSASATGFLCTTNTTPCTSKAAVNTEIKSKLKSAKAILTAGFGKVECSKSEVNGHTKTTGEGGSAGLAEGPITTLAFSECNGTVTTEKTGSLSVSWTETMNGNLTASGFQVHTVVAGVACTYGGTVSEKIKFIGSPEAGKPAIVKAEEAPIPKVEGGFLCGEPAHWNAEYEVTTPAELYMSKE